MLFIWVGVEGAQPLDSELCCQHFEGIFSPHLRFWRWKEQISPLCWQTSPLPSG